MTRIHSLLICTVVVVLGVHHGAAITSGERHGSRELVDGAPKQSQHRITSVRVHSSGTVTSSKTAPNRTGSVPAPVVPQWERVESTGDLVLQRGGNTSANASVPSLTTNEWHERVRNRNARLFDIQRHIMYELQLKRRPNVTGHLSAEQLDKLREHLDASSQSGSYMADDAEEDDGVTTRRFFALRPTCPLVDGVRQDWFPGGPKFRLFFNIDPPDDDITRKTKVTSAILRLSRKPLEAIERTKNYSSRTQSAENRKNRRPTDDERRVLRGRKTGRVERGTIKNERTNERSEKERNSNSKRLSTNSKAAAKLILKIYQYTQPVVSNLTEVKDLIRNTTMKGGRSGYLNLNVKSIVRQWYRNPDNNFGIELAVTDQTGSRIDPRNVFNGFNCSHPISDGQPALISMSIPRDDKGSLQLPALPSSILGDGFVSPNLDIATIQVPRRGHTKRQGEVSRRIVMHRHEIIGRSTDGLRRRAPRELRVQNSMTLSGEEKNGCRTRKEFVRFSDVGLSGLIVKPNGFVFGTCDGTCRNCTGNIDMLKITSKHQKQHRKRRTGCCHPTRRQDLTLMLRDGQQLKLDKFLVTDCACVANSS